MRVGTIFTTRRHCMLANKPNKYYHTRDYEIGYWKRLHSWLQQWNHLKKHNISKAERQCETMCYW